MVIIFGDNLKAVRHPLGCWVVTMSLSAVFVVLQFYPDLSNLAVRFLGFTPLRFSLHPAISLPTLISAEFLHIDVLHLIGNLIFFSAIGRSIERAVGTLVFLGTFFGLGAMAFLGSWLITPGSPVPIVGCSGAVSLLLGSYVILFPRAKLLLLPFAKKITIRAWAFTVAWMGLQLFGALSSGELNDGIAYWTHIAGFLIGMVAAGAWREFGLDTHRLLMRLQGRDS